MQQIRNPRAQGPGGGVARRPVRIPDEQAEIAELFARYTAALDKRFQKALEGIHRSALRVMRQLVAEVWRAGGPDASRSLKEGVLGTIARDDAVRGLLTHTDERYQALSVRMDEMQGAVRRLAEATREAVARANQRASEAAAATQTVTHAAQAFDRLGRSLAPLAGRVDAMASALERHERRHREDLARLAERTAGAMAEVQRRLHRIVRGESERLRGSVQGELQRLEAAVRSETAFGGQAVADLQRSIAELAERTGNVLAGLEQRLLHQHQELTALSDRTTRAVAGASERILEETRAMLARIEAIENRADGVEKALEGHRKQLATFSDRASRGLDELARRIREGFRLALERSAAERRQAVEGLEASLRRELGAVRADMEGIAARTGQVLEGLRAHLGERVDRAGRAGRDETLHLVTGLVTRQGGQQVKSLEAVRRSLHALLDSVRRSGQQQAAAVERVLRASAGRQEALLDEVLSALRTSLEELNGVASPEEGAEETASGDALTRRLRGVEHRLAQLSRELAGDPAAGA